MNKIFYYSTNANEIYLVGSTEDIRKAWGNIITEDKIEREFVDDAKFSLSKKTYVIKFDFTYENQFDKILVSIISADTLMYLQLINEIMTIGEMTNDIILSRIRYIDSITKL